MRFIPNTKLGRLSVWLIVTFFVFLGLFFVFVNLGERGGDTFFSNLKLTIPILIAAFCAIGSFITGVLSFRKERAVLVFISSLIGLFVLWWCVMEIVFPH